jgi:hypothetical protein
MGRLASSSLLERAEFAIEAVRLQHARTGSAATREPPIDMAFLIVAAQALREVADEAVKRVPGPAGDDLGAGISRFDERAEGLLQAAADDLNLPMVQIIEMLGNEGRLGADGLTRRMRNEILHANREVLPGFRLTSNQVVSVPAEGDPEGAWSVAYLDDNDVAAAAEALYGQLRPALESIRS